MAITLESLRAHALHRSLFKPSSLKQALSRLGFVQADPIRAPARAQDLTLRHRVANYQAGDLERLYPKLNIEEDFFVNYGFLTPEHHALMHPRTPRTVWPKAQWKRAHAVLDFVRERGVVHPREVDAHFQHGKSTNWFGGSSNASTQLLDGLHYRGLLRVARREGGTRLYAARPAWPEHGDTAACQQRMDALVDLAVAKYAPVPAPSLGTLLSHLRGAAPQWMGDRAAALARAKKRLARTTVDGVDWYWPSGERFKRQGAADDGQARLLTPFDPVVWDRTRFELFWGWAYRFEAYTPAPKRKLGYYALPLLWQHQVVGWANVNQGANGAVTADAGLVNGQRPSPTLNAALEAELQRMRTFLGMGAGDTELRWR